MADLVEQLSSISSRAEVLALGDVAGIVDAVQSHPERGLAPAQVEVNRAKFGSNRLPSKTTRSFFAHLMEAFEDTTLKILVVSAAFSMLFGFFLSKTTADVIQGVAILTAVVIVSGANARTSAQRNDEVTCLSTAPTSLASSRCQLVSELEQGPRVSDAREDQGRPRRAGRARRRGVARVYLRPRRRRRRHPRVGRWPPGGRRPRCALAAGPCARHCHPPPLSLLLQSTATTLRWTRAP